VVETFSSPAMARIASAVAAGSSGRLFISTCPTSPLDRD
jgi:hypothetical protein